MSITDLYPDYPTTSPIDSLRQSEYSYLDEQDHVYLDYTGSGLAARSQHAHHTSRLASTVLGNPHSTNPTSSSATEAIHLTRSRILAHLNASEDEYVVIFTANATAAARLVGESYPFSRKTGFVVTADNHNSINGIRELAGARGATTRYVPITTPDLRIETAKVVSALSDAKQRFSLASSSWKGAKKLFSSCFRSTRSFSLSSPSESNKLDDSGSEFSSEKPKNSCPSVSKNKKSNNNNNNNNKNNSNNNKKSSKGLFAFPAQSNFTGVRHPLSWVSLAQQNGYDVLLDAAAYLPTSTLDLSVARPEFVIASWYKVFGYPTGVGCLIAKKEALGRLKRPWFAGGTVQAVTVAMPWHSMAKNEEAFEDGTVNFWSIPDVAYGLDFLTDSVGMDMMSTRVKYLTGWFLWRLQSLQHSDGRAMVRIYGPTDPSLVMRGGTVAFNFLDAEGKVVDERIVGAGAAAARVSLRTGCFCNPGAGEAALELDAAAIKKLASTKQLTGGVDEFVRLLGLPSAGAIRVSFGVASTVNDVDRFFEFAKVYRDKVISSEGLPPRT